jgi:hypothetical protein
MQRINWKLYDNCKIGCDDCGVTINNFKKSQNTKKTIKLAEGLFEEINIYKDDLQLQFYKDGDPLEIESNKFSEFINELLNINKIKELHLSSVLSSFSNKSKKWFEEFRPNTKGKILTWTFSIAEIKSKAKWDEEVIKFNIDKIRNIGFNKIYIRTFKHRSGFPNAEEEQELRYLADRCQIDFAIIENNNFPNKEIKNIEFYSDCGII